VALWRAVGEADAVVLHDALYVTSILALAMARLRGKRSVLIQHIAGIPFASRMMRAVMGLANLVVTRPMLAAAGEVVFISDTVRRDLLGEPARRPYHLLFNGVDSEVFHRNGPAAALPGKGRTCCSWAALWKEGAGRAARTGPPAPRLHAAAGGRRADPPRRMGAGQCPRSWPARRPAACRPLSRGRLSGAAQRGRGFSAGDPGSDGLRPAGDLRRPHPSGRPEAARWLQGVAVDLADPAAAAARVAALLDKPVPDREAMARWAAARYSWEAMAREVLRQLDNLAARIFKLAARLGQALVCRAARPHAQRARHRIIERAARQGDGGACAIRAGAQMRAASRSLSSISLSDRRSGRLARSGRLYTRSSASGASMLPINT
jgi:hypothetical protein